MSLVKTSPEITSLSGSFAGQTFKRDGSGLHIVAKPRRVRQCTDAQRIQRNAFTAARKLSSDNRTVSYYIYRKLNDLPILPVPLDYNPPHIAEYEIA